MKVKCIANNGAVLFGSYLDDGNTIKTEFDGLAIGKEYVVYAWDRYKDGSVYYYVDDDCDRDYPSAIPAPLIEVTDPTPSRVWQFAKTDSYEEWGWAEWVNEQYFYDRLVNKQPRELAIYKTYKALLDEEEMASNNKDEVGD